MTASFPANGPAPGRPHVVKRPISASLIWLVPGAAVLIGISMLIHAWLAMGPTITISFQTASGLEAGKTPVKYRDVTIGTVASVALSGDGKGVTATVDLDKSAQDIARADSRFWVVRPRIGLGGVSGIDTLLSGAYIGVDKGVSSESSLAFVGLEVPPTVTHDALGKSFVLHAEDLGSLDVGSPVYYRHIQVGHVASYQLDADGKHVSVPIFIKAPYDALVTTSTRFWNASGVDVSLGADGLKLNTQSLATVMSGGIAFANIPGREAGPAPSESAYTLAKDQQAAMVPPDGPVQYFQLRFEHSLRGLTIGAPVEFFGQDIGHVVSVRLDYDPGRRQFLTVVGLVAYPNRLGGVLEKLPKEATDGSEPERQTAQFLEAMVEHGLRAQARSGNLLTGQLYISLDFIPKAAPVHFDVDARPLILPTVGGDFDRMQEQLAGIINKVDNMPLESIGRHLDGSLAGVDEALRKVNAEVLPQTTLTLQQAQQTLGSAQAFLGEDGALQGNVNQTLEQLQRATHSLRVFLDLLSRHPEALLRGGPGDASPVSEKDRAAASKERSP